MKKILLFLMLASLNLVAQTPIWHYTFNGNSSPVNLKEIMEVHYLKFLEVLQMPQISERIVLEIQE